MSERKRYPSVKKVSLAGLSEEWDESCFAYVIPSSYDDQLALAELNTTEMTDAETTAYQLRFVREHFVSGKIKVFNGDSFVEEDMTPSDTAATIDITDRLYAEIMGIGLDPKEIRKVAERSTLQSTEESPTSSPSSETTPAT